MKNTVVILTSVLLMVSIMYLLMIVMFPKDVEFERMIEKSRIAIEGLADTEPNICHEPMTKYTIERCR